jgi:ABC-2 type transport system ATP-binding protein
VATSGCAQLCVPSVRLNYEISSNLKGLPKRFPEGLFGRRTVLDNIDFTVSQGNFIVLRGANGAGKSTLIKLILGLQEADSGSVKLFGQSPMAPEARLLLGTVFQEVTPPNSLKVRELINLVRSYYPEPKSTTEILENCWPAGQAACFSQRPSGGSKTKIVFCDRPGR